MSKYIGLLNCGKMKSIQLFPLLYISGVKR